MSMGQEIPRMTSDPGPLRSTFAHDPEMVELIQEFVAELPKRLDAIQKAYRDGAAQDLKRLAHQLRGSAGGYGFPDVSDAAATVEDRLRAMNETGDASLRMVEREVAQLVHLCSRVSA